MLRTKNATISSHLGEKMQGEGEGHHSSHPHPFPLAAMWTGPYGPPEGEGVNNIYDAFGGNREWCIVMELMRRSHEIFSEAVLMSEVEQ